MHPVHVSNPTTAYRVNLYSSANRLEMVRYHYYLKMKSTRNEMFCTCDAYPIKNIILQHITSGTTSVYVKKKTFKLTVPGLTDRSLIIVVVLPGDRY